MVLKKIIIQTCTVMMIAGMLSAGVFAQNVERHTQDAENASNKEAEIEFVYTEGSIYRIYCRPGYLTDIKLKPGEEITFVGGGDTERWIIDTAKSGIGRGRINHIYLKPVQAGISTNLIINTNMHSYHIQIIATDSYNPIVSWSYPKEEQEALKVNGDEGFIPSASPPREQKEAQRANDGEKIIPSFSSQKELKTVRKVNTDDRSVTSQTVSQKEPKAVQKVNVNDKSVPSKLLPQKEPKASVNVKSASAENPPQKIALDYNYVIENRKPVWAPVEVFNDGRKTWIRMPAGMATTSAPVLYVKEGKNLALVNYRVKNYYYMVDQIFDVAELRSGQETVTIRRVR